MSTGAAQPGWPPRRRPRVKVLPTNTLGWWAVGLAAAFFPLVFAAALVPRAAALGVVCALAGGVLGSTAVIRNGERAVTVIASLVPLVIAGAFVVAEVVGAA